MARPRDAEATRRALLHAARRRFAQDGYAATTVRDVAADAGVNVALINRYFVSKEGLFEACVTQVDGRLRDPSETASLERLVTSIVDGVVDDDLPLQMVLLLRSSGDPAGDRIRRAALRDFAERIAAADGGGAGDLDDERLLRAEVLLAAALGLALLRISTGLEPLASASAADLAGPARDLTAALLGR